MSHFSSIILLISFFQFPSQSVMTDPDPQDLVGTWEVTIDNGSSGDPDVTTLEISNISEKSFKGTFYYSEMGECRLTVRDGVIYMAFITEDGSGYYANVGKWEGEIMEGTTHSVGRDFLAIWTAVKKK